MHSHVELFVCTRGNICIITPDKELNLFSGDIAVIPPNYPHTRFIGDKDSDSEWCSISYLCVKRQSKDSKELYDSFVALAAENNVVLMRDKLRFCLEIYDIVRNAPDHDSILPALRVVTAISGIIHECGDADSEIHHVQPSQQTSDIDIGLLYKLNHIINTYFMNELTNAQIAEMLFISERQLSRIATKHYGTSVRHLIIDRRLVTAEKLLHDTNNTVESIGTSLGYNSKSGFYRDFRKKYGVTPVEYRKNYLNEKGVFNQKQD